MWAKGAAVGNARRAAPRCPRSRPVHRRRIVHRSIAPPGAQRPAPAARCFSVCWRSRFDHFNFGLAQAAQDQLFRALGAPRPDATL